MNRFSKDDWVLNYDKSHTGIIVDVVSCYTVNWDDGSTSYYVHESQLSPKFKSPEYKTIACKRCLGLTQHNVSRTLGQVFFRCERCGRRNGEKEL